MSPKRLPSASWLLAARMRKPRALEGCQQSLDSFVERITSNIQMRALLLAFRLRGSKEEALEIHDPNRPFED
eukprot:4285835-Karenia_brevis.AAC.1